MYAVAGTAQSVRVTGNLERARKIQERLDALGISDREFQEQTKVDRKALRRAANGEKVRGSTYTAIETWLTRLESENGEGVEFHEEAPRLIRITVHDVYGIGEIVAEGGTPAEVAEAVRLVVDQFRDQER